MAIGISLGVIILFIVGCYMYKKQKFESDIFNKKSFISFSDLIIQRNTAGSMTESYASLSDIDSVRNGSATEGEINILKGNWHRGYQKFIAKYRHDVVYVKKLRKVQLPQTRDILLEIKLARDVHHINVNSYVGVIMESPQICIVTPYCTKGSLRDVLQNEDIQLDWVFRVSFMNDIAAGMCELHDSGVGVHGNLTSHNILLDNRWLCKITDFGLEMFKDMSHLGPKKDLDLTEEEKYKCLRWKAPELLNIPTKRATKQGDAYSFGIIMSEIITRLEPFESYGYKSKDVISYIQRRCLPPFRPHVRLQSGVDGRILDVMRRCWHEFPSERYTFVEIRKILKKMLKDRNENNDLVDNVLAMMEKYTNHLEKRVQERTELLHKEKEKAERLLYQMLPEPVAERLKLGEIIRPIIYRDVSILMTDIVGFSSLCLECQPMQVVDLLNDLYSTFDQIIDKFDCYKLENENEKYIVVSGLPKSNGSNNVKITAMMSLKLMSKMTSFKIRHNHELKLNLRVCLHNGDVCAGVVGMKTPRYHIFGAAVQYIRHLQLTGPPLSIQISQEFNEKLSKYKVFETKMRGPIKVKQRGLVTPYFLLGKEGLDLPMPTPVEDIGVVTNFDIAKSAGDGKKSMVNRKA